MNRWIAPAGAVRRIALAVGVVIVAVLAVAMMRGWDVFDFGPAQTTDFTKPLESPLEAQQARAAAETAEAVAAAQGQRREADIVTAERVQRLIAEMSAADAATRERADVALRNLPVRAAPLVEAAYERDKDSFDPEPRARLEQSVSMFRALAAVERRRRERVEWVRQALLTAYGELGEHDPTWDAAARRVLVLAAESEWDAEQEVAIAAALSEADRAGCKDPLVMFHKVLADNRDPSSDETLVIGDAMKVAEAMQRSEYPFWIKVHVTARCAGIVDELQRDVFEPSKVHTRFIKLGAAGAFMATADVSEAAGMPDALLYDVARVAYRAEPDLGTSMERFQRVYRQYERLAGANAPLLPLFKGVCHLERADEYPNYTRRADQGHVEEAEAYRRRHLETAEQSLKLAVERAPESPLVALQMMKLHLKLGNAEQIEKWYQRAMSLYPDYLDACWTRIWAMDADARLDFARELLRQQNYRGQLPFVLVDLHASRADWSGEKETYFEQPGVWDDIRAVYSGYLDLFPKDVLVRSKYARYANRCRQYAEADRQFKILGENPALRVFGSMTSYNYHRKKAARNAGAMGAASE